MVPHNMVIGRNPTIRTAAVLILSLTLIYLPQKIYKMDDCVYNFTTRKEDNTTLYFVFDPMRILQIKVTNLPEGHIGDPEVS